MKKNENYFEIVQKAEGLSDDFNNKPTYEQTKYLKQIENYYTAYPEKEIADIYAKMLYDMSFSLTNINQKHAQIKILEDLLEKHQTKDIAIVVGRIKYNMLNESNAKLKDFMKCAKYIEDLYKKFPNELLAEPLAKIWTDIFIKKKKLQDKLIYAQKIKQLCLEIDEPNTNTAYAKVLFSDKVNFENIEELVDSFFDKSHDIDTFWTFYISSFYEKYSNYIEKFNLTDSYPVEFIGTKINQYFQKIKSEKNYINIKTEILCVLYCVFSIKELLRVNEINYPIGHYTKIENLKYLLPDNSKLRMYNANYMNDPSEGCTLLDYLFSNNYSKSDKSSNIYLSCFTTALDNLPMWSMYGNDGDGCCLILDKGFFDTNNERMTDEFMFYNHKENNNNYLYRVCYINNKYNSFEVKINYCNEDYDTYLEDLLCEWMKELKKHVTNILKIEMKKNNIINEIIEFILGQIKYLFKDISYSHECELRLLKYSEKPELDEDSFKVPILYENIDRPLKYDKIILGPKVSQINKIIPYIEYTKKVKNITQSKIKYQ